MAIHVTLLSFDGCMASAVFGTLDFLITANYCAREHRGAHPPEPLFRARIATPGGEPVHGYSGARIVPDCAMEEVGRSDVVVVSSPFPALSARDAASGALSRLRGVPPWLRKQHERGALLATACTGSFLLAEAGLLTGRSTTTHWGAEAAFRERYPDVALDTSHMVIDLGELVCAGGATSYVDLSLHLIERLAGRRLARDCARCLVADPRRDSQSPYQTLIGHADHDDDGVMRAQQWLEEHFAEPVSLRALAASFAMSPRTLSRRFKAATGESPIQYLQRVRIEAVKERLVTERTPIDEIVRRCGYDDENSFRRLFRRHTGESMRSYRSRFGRPPTAPSSE